MVRALSILMHKNSILGSKVFFQPWLEGLPETTALLAFKFPL